MRRSTVPFVLIVISVAGLGAALVWRAYTVRQDARGDETIVVPFERVQNTATIPPEYNARATYNIEPRFVVRRRHEEEFRRLVDFHRPAIMDALQTLLTKVHYLRFQNGEEPGPGMALQIRAEVNRVIGREWVVEVTFLGPGQ